MEREMERGVKVSGDKKSCLIYCEIFIEDV